MPLVLGLDCGGSNTRALVLDENGVEHFRGSGGPANVASSSPEVLRASLKAAVAGCPEVAAVAGCFAGLLTKGERERAEGILGEMFTTASVRAWPDYAAALASTPGLDAVMVNGTGSVSAWWENGEIRKLGGGGPLLGDYGSAYWLGRTVIGEAVFIDRWFPALSTFVTDRYGTREPDEVIAAIYRSGSPAAELGLAAKPTVEAWEAGDEMAKQALDSFLFTILTQLSSLSQQVAKPGARIGLTGGFWKLSPRLLPRLLEVNRERDQPLPAENDVRIEVLANEPVVGAANLARQLLSS